MIPPHVRPVVIEDTAFARPTRARRRPLRRAILFLVLISGLVAGRSLLLGPVVSALFVVCLFLAMAVATIAVRGIRQMRASAIKRAAILGAAILVLILLANAIAASPPVDNLIDRHEDTRFPGPSYVVTDADGSVLFVTPRPIDRERLRDSLLARSVVIIEDRRYEMRFGLALYDPITVLRVLLEAMKGKRQGGSGIDLQLSKKIWGTPGRSTIAEKPAHWAIALRLAQRFENVEVLGRYLDAEDFGTSTGVVALSYRLFRKPPEELLPAEAATVAAMLNGSSEFNPVSTDEATREAARERRNLVLELMHDAGYLTDDEYAAAIAAPLPSPSMADRETERLAGIAVRWHGQVLTEQLDKLTGTSRGRQ